MNPKKVLLLGALLLVPVLVFLLLKGFGTNHYNLRYYFPVVTYEGEALVQNGDTVFRKIPDFKLTNQEGKPLRNATSIIIFTSPISFLHRARAFARKCLRK